MAKSKLSWRHLAWPILYILLAIAAVCLTASRYKTAHFGDAKIDEILFYFQTGLADGQSGSIWQAAVDNLYFVGILFFLMLLPVIDLFRNRIRVAINLSFLGRKRKTREYNPSKLRLRYKLIYALILFIIGVWSLLASFGVPEYLRSLSQSSLLYEQNYVDPEKAALVFPEKKRNLVYIYMESMENSIASKDNGGQSEKSIIPELEAIALNPKNVSFSNQPAGLGGALPATGTTWTVGGMIAQSSGIPQKSTLLGQDHNGMGAFKEFLPGAYSLGDILHKQGYNQTFLMGSSANFGGRDKLLTQHGQYNIQDYDFAKTNGKFAPDYSVWWGFEDKKLFQYAQDEATRLASLNQPFNLQLLTVDTHFTDGYLDQTCPTPYAAQYDNVYACSSGQVERFVKWLQAQPFANDTTIILTGDHLGMQTSYYDQKITKPNYQRTIYNAFINPALTPIKSHERLFSSFDMYPSTLAAMGVSIPEDRLGLGVNLFSDKPTLVEQFGSIDALNGELAKRSDYYERNLLVKPK